MLTSCFLINDKCHQLFSALTRTYPDPRECSFGTMKLVKGPGPRECPRPPRSPPWQPEQTAQMTGHRADLGRPGTAAGKARPLLLVFRHTAIIPQPLQAWEKEPQGQKQHLKKIDLWFFQDGKKGKTGPKGLLTYTLL